MSAAIKHSSKNQLSELSESNSLAILQDISGNLKPRVVKFNNVYKDSFSFQVYNHQSGNLILNSIGSLDVSTFEKTCLDSFQIINLKTPEGLKL